METTDSPLHLISLLAQESIYLQTNNGHLSLDSNITAPKVDLFNTNGPIEIKGTFLSSQALVRSSNGAIKGSYSTTSTLDLQTSNAPILVEIALLSPPPSHDSDSNSEKERFEIKVKSSNGPLEVKYVEQPLGSYLKSRVETSNARVEVEMRAEFQGMFDVSFGFWVLFFFHIPI